MRVNKALFFILIMSLMIVLSSSSFFLPHYLTKQIKDNNYNQAQFSFALKKGYIAALTIQEASVKFGSSDWLSLNQTIAKSQGLSALKLGYWYQKLADKKNNDALNNTAILWFQQAIRLHSEKAIVALAQLYFEQGKLAKSKATLSLLPNKGIEGNFNEAALILRIKIAVFLGDVALVEQLLATHTSKFYGKDKANQLLADIVKYGVIKDRQPEASSPYKQSSYSLEKSSSCITSLQLFATNLAHLKYLEQLMQTFKEQQPLAQFVCLPPPKYIGMQLLDCLADPKQAITCDESRWQAVAQKVNTRHIGLMLDKGGANVHLGILYFDIEDDVNVFSHEISHLLGFVDEYPLIQNHNACNAPQQQAFSHNTVVLNNLYQGEQQKLREEILASVPWANKIKADTPILQSIVESSNKQKLKENKQDKQGKWRLGTPIKYKDQVGLHISESCHNTIAPRDSSSIVSVPAYSAYKPVSRRTQLRYFSDEFPIEYIALLTDKPKMFLMPSFHYNIALALFQQGKIEESKLWLIQAASWESEPLKKALILKGGF